MPGRSVVLQRVLDAVDTDLSVMPGFDSFSFCARTNAATATYLWRALWEHN